MRKMGKGIVVLCNGEMNSYESLREVTLNSLLGIPNLFYICTFIISLVFLMLYEEKQNDPHI